MKKFFILLLIAGFIFTQAFTNNSEPASKAELGKLLFFDPILSKNKTISCASCHNPAYAFSDSSAVSKGVRSRKGTRNTPSVMNLSLKKNFFWDGRANSLEEQALAPIENPLEMDLPIEKAVRRLQHHKAYSRFFKKIFNGEPTGDRLAAALAAFERTLETSDSPFDNWKFADDESAISNAVKKGFIVFNGKGKCIECHFGSDFTRDEFRNIGLFNGKNWNDSGRAAISGRKEDLGKFAIPGLRNVAITAPYMHNGSFKTLEEVIEFYNDPAKLVPDGINRDILLSKPLGLTEEEKKDLKAFLISLTDKRFISRR